MFKTTPSVNVSSKPESHYRWLVVALIFVITIINYFDRSALSYAIGPITKEFGLNNADFGFIAAAFGVGYVVMTFVGGLLVDHFGSHKIWAGAAALWSLVTIALGLASGFWIFCLLRTMLGLAEGPHFPALTRAITDWLPVSERARASGFALTGVPMASVIGAPLISQLIVHIGWKLTFVVLGSLGLIWVALWLFLYRDYPENSPFVSNSELVHIRDGVASDRNQPCQQLRSHNLQEGKTTWKFLLCNPSLMANNLAFFSFGYLAFFAMSWLPGYLEQTYQLHLSQVGIFLIAPWATAAVLVSVAGYLSDWLWLKTGSSRIARSHMIWICQLLSALCFVPVIFVHSLTVSIICISLGLGLGLMPNAAFYALNSDLACDRAGTSIGIMDCFFAVSGILAPALTGIVSNATGNFAAAFGLLIGFTLISVVAILFFQHPDKKDQGSVISS